MLRNSLFRTSYKSDVGVSPSGILYNGKNANRDASRLRLSIISCSNRPIYTIDHLANISLFSK